MNLIICLVILNAGCCFLQVKSECIDVDPVKDFEPKKFTGTWYGIAKFVNKYDTSLKCSVYEITLDEATNALNVSEKQIESYYEGPVDITDLLYPVEGPNVANFNAIVDGRRRKGTYPIKIISLDYDRYCIVYGCEKKHDYLWAASRQREVTDDFINEIKTIIQSKGLNEKKLLIIDQSNCNN